MTITITQSQIIKTVVEHGPIEQSELFRVMHKQGFHTYTPEFRLEFLALVRIELLTNPLRGDISIDTDRP